MLFDTHAHLNDEAFNKDREELLEGLAQKGVGLVMNAGCSLQASREVVEMADKYPWLYAAVGSHPDAADEVNEDVLEECRKLCKLNPKVKAIGEIGLDYHYEDIPRGIQQKAFRLQMELARELDLPVIVHEREAHEDGMAIVREFPQVKGVFHCYSGSAEMARQLVEMGWYIGFTGVLTFKNARKAVETAASIPLERIVLDTDCPYMAPVPFRGKRCTSDMIAHTAAKIAEIKEISPQQMVDIARENTCRLFGIK